MIQSHHSFDLALVGGGLANALIALAVLERSPWRRLLMVESEARLGGNHTWSFHGGDVGRGHSFVEPLIEHRWPSYRVEFPGASRRVTQSYASVTSQRLHAQVAEAFERSAGSQLLLGKRAVHVAENYVSLADGAVFGAKLVVDGRGPERWQPRPGCHYQKFLGLELLLSGPAPVHEPVLMDARVPQEDGFRFVYVLPFSERRVLIEDTYFSATSALDTAELERRIFQYAHACGYAVKSVLRREQGVLPLPAHMPSAQPVRGPLLSGFQGGWFHPTTGYSFPAAVSLASFIARHEPEQVFGRPLVELLRERRRQQRFFCFLNRLMVGAFPPSQRFHVLERFYGLPEDTVRRFYAMQSTTGDRARILCGRPPRGLSVTHVLTTQGAA